MVVRRRRKVQKMRGSRTMGGGSVKKRRGAGHKGGRGMAGSHKHKWTTIVRSGIEYFGKRGFKSVAKKAGIVKPTINVGELDQLLDRLIEKEEVRREDGKFVVEVDKLGVEKVLGRGRVTRAMKVVAKEFSKLAKEKIEGAGGEAVAG
ncbi:MAG: uL15 family ribosomal protein [Hadesarchaea archaeon]|nr:uL15 family ribosomal protein [Hadesarchaea archaeon]